MSVISSITRRISGIKRAVFSDDAIRLSGMMKRPEMTLSLSASRMSNER